MISSTPADRVSVAAPSAVYVYAFVESMRLAGLHPSSAAPHSVMPHPVGDICGLISLVPTAEFHGAEGERNLADPAWIMPRICRHEAIVETAMAVSPVFPTRFATLFASLDSLSTFMRRHEGTIGGFLRQVTGKEEWSLKISADLDDVASLDELATELWPAWSGHSAGTRYLLLRQERPTLLRVAGERAARRMPDIAEGLRAWTTAIRALVPSGAPSGPGVRVATYALLAPCAQRDALHEQVDRLAADWARRRFRIALSGPWPPYSFRPDLDRK